MGRLLLLLLIAGGLVVFAAQNLSPVALVVLGVRTQALPLSVWVLSFVAAGALTTLVLSGFFSLSKNAAVRRSAQREAKPRSPWTSAKDPQNNPSTKTTAGFTSSGSSSDDWENRRSEWDDWAEGQSPRSPQPPKPGNAASGRSRESNRERDRQPSRNPRDDIRDSAGAQDNRGRRSSSPEVGRSPLEQAGFSRRETPRKSDEVYDAEYRVLIPPYQSPPPAPPAPAPQDVVKPTEPPKPANPDDEDWL